MKNAIRLSAMIGFGFYLLACSQENKAYTEEIPIEESNYSDYEKDETVTYMDDSEYAPEMEQASEDQLGGLVEQQKDISAKDHASIISSRGLTNPFKDKKFIKTADLHFRVGDVYTSSINIEEIIIANDGFLLNSNLYTDIYNSSTFSMGKDSLIKVEEFQTRNNITLRIPNENMHRCLLAIAEEIEFLDSRVLAADDVGLKLLAEELAQKRNAKSSGNLQNSVNAGGKLEDKVYAESIAFQRETEKDIALIKEMSIEDQVAYSTITLAIYQAPELSTQKMLDLNAYKTQFEKPYSKELADAFSNGFEGIKTMFKFALAIWPIFILFGLGVVAYRRFF